MSTEQYGSKSSRKFIGETFFLNDPYTKKDLWIEIQESLNHINKDYLLKFSISIPERVKVVRDVRRGSD